MMGYGEGDQSSAPPAAERRSRLVEKASMTPGRRAKEKKERERTRREKASQKVAKVVGDNGAMAKAKEEMERRIR